MKNLATLSLLLSLTANIFASPAQRLGSVADLTSITHFSSVDPYYQTSYYSVFGDGGGGNWVYQPGVTASYTNSHLGCDIKVSTGNLHDIDCDLGMISPAKFGALPNDSGDDVASFQATSDYLRFKDGGTIDTPAGQYVFTASSLHLGYKVNLTGQPSRISENSSAVESNLRFKASSASQINTRFDGDAILLDDSIGEIIQPLDVAEDGTTNNSVAAYNRISNIDFVNLISTKSVWNASCIKAFNRWYIEIDKCTFTGYRGYAVYLFDVNAATIHNNGGSCPVQTSNGFLFMYGCSDSSAYGNYVGAGAAGIWLCGRTTFNNQIHDNFLYNAMPLRWEISSVINSNITLITPGFYAPATVGNESGGVRGSDGSPVLFYNVGGNLPTGINRTNVYWLHRISTNQFQVYTNHTLTAAVTMVNDGTGTNYMTMGPGSALWSTFNASQNLIHDNRFDQNYGPGATFQDTVGGTFDHNLVTLNGYDSSPGSGVPGNSPTGIPTPGAYFGPGSSAISVDHNTGSAAIGSFSFCSQTMGVQVSTNASDMRVWMNIVTGIQTNDVPSISLNGVLPEQVGLLEIGATNLGSVLRLKGGLGGARMLIFERLGMPDRGIGNGGNGITFVEEPTNQLAQLGTVVGEKALVLGSPGTLRATNSVLSGEFVTITSNGPSGNLKLWPGRGTGTGAVGSIIFQLPITNTDSANQQTFADRVVIGPRRNDGETPLWLYDGTVTQRVHLSAAISSLGNGRVLYAAGVTNATLNLGGTNLSIVLVNGTQVINPNFFTQAGHDIGFGIGSSTNVVADLQTNTVSTSKLIDSAVTSNKVASGAINISKITGDGNTNHFLRGDVAWATPVGLVVTNYISRYGKARVHMTNNGTVYGIDFATASYTGHVTNTINGSAGQIIDNGTNLRFIFDETRSNTNYNIAVELETSDATRRYVWGVDSSTQARDVDKFELWVRNLPSQVDTNTCFKDGWIRVLVTDEN